MAGLYHIIPGLKEAENKYVSDQEEAFLSLEPLIGGKIELLPFTPQMFLELDLVGCEVLRSDVPALEDVAMFLWRCSAKFERGKLLSKWKRDRFVRQVSSLPYGEVVLDVTDYLDRAYAPMPLVKRKKSEKKTRSFAAWPSKLVHAFGASYGWSETQTLNTPFRRLYQYLNRIIEDGDPEYKQACPAALELRDQWLKRANSKDTEDK